MNSIEVVRNGGTDCGNGGHSRLFWGCFDVRSRVTRANLGNPKCSVYLMA